ncbi:mobile mystery protein A [soil metagenome]
MTKPCLYYDYAVDIGRARLDERLADVRVPARPRAGWLRAVRDALGMSGRQLGDRLGVSQQRVSAMERAEIDGSLTLASLRGAADALGCDVAYVLVPRRRLGETVKARATELAESEARALADTMALEDQSVEDRRMQQWIDGRADELSRSRRLWDRP